MIEWLASINFLRSSTFMTDAKNIDKTSTARSNRPSEVSEILKTWIADKGMSPGDRLPQEADLINDFEVSKGTMREALKVLETQGLIQTRTGPGGGAFITEMPATRARALLANHFFYKDFTISDIYELRLALEPELAAQVATHITAEQIDTLKKTMVEYGHPPETVEEETRQRVAELVFHEQLANYSNNPLMSFTCGFLVSLLKDLAVCKKIYRRSNPELRERGLSYQGLLIEAFGAGDVEGARSIMHAHMIAARRLMLEQEAIVNRGFLSISGDTVRASQRT